MKNKLSGREQEVYFNLEVGMIYDVNAILNLVHLKKNYLPAVLSSMNRKGWLTRLKRGVYLVNSPKLKVLTDPFLAATNIFRGYLGFSSALYIYGAMDEYPSTIFVCTRETSALRSLSGSIEVKAVALGVRATGEVPFNGYFVSSKAKTLYDNFYLPEYSGGYSNLIAAIPRLNLDSDDWKMFLFYAKKFGKSGFCRKVGFLLDTLNSFASGIVPESVLKGLNFGKQVVKLGNGHNGKFIRKWHVVSYIGEGDLFGKMDYG